MHWHNASELSILIEFELNILAIDIVLQFQDWIIDSQNYVHVPIVKEIKQTKNNRK